ncbi:ATP-dependent helicase [Candidatus Fermentibacteria bacterium]|nr:MAG: ATP-dependent helicase [Candidatus Fermentibacteria bacterium]
MYRVFAALSFPRVRRVEICINPGPGNKLRNYSANASHRRHRRSAPGSTNPGFHLEPAAKTPEGVFGSLIPAIQQAVSVEGYVTPTPIQEQCIPHLLEGRDLIGTAQTGTGKTAAFTLPLLQRLARHSRRPRRGTPRALILAPTRELAAQIGNSVQTYGKYLNLQHTVIFGGVKQYSQVKTLNRGVDVLVATPGRLLDLIQQGFIHLDEVEVFILDEVDRMLDMGFIHDINRVLAEIPPTRQTLFFSATMAPKMELLAKTMVTNPVRVTIEPEKPTVDSISQKVLFVEKANKDALLASLLNDRKVKKAIVFTQMKHTANKVVKKLASSGIYGTAIHGNKSQAMRTKALDGFKKGRYRVLVATDVAARGLDVDDITHVFNYDLPVESETYVHRIGRTARAGADGDAVSFCSSEERYYLREIEKLLGNQVPADMSHEFHSEEAFRSQKPAPGNSRRGRSQPGKPSYSGNSRRSGGHRRGTNPSGRSRQRNAPSSGSRHSGR